MAVRPVVLLFQEFEQVSISPETPDLNTLIVGPAYHIQDYAADKGNLLLGTYGSLAAPSSELDGRSTGVPTAGTTALLVSSPPGNVTGALLDHTSVQLYVDSGRAELAFGTDGAYATVAPDENVFTSASTDFAALGVRPGDYLIVTGNGGTNAPAGVTVQKLIQEVGGVSGSPLLAGQVRVTSNFSAAGTSVDGTAYTVLDATDLDFRVETVITDAELDADFRTLSGNTLSVLGGAQVYVTSGDFEGYVRLTYGSLYMEYRALRQDLAELLELETVEDISLRVGRIDERNPLAVGLFVAMQNTNTSIKFFGITGDNLNGATDRLVSYQSALDIIEAREDVYTIVPLASELSVITAMRQYVTQLAEPEISNLRTVIGAADDLPLTKEVSDASTTGAHETVLADNISVFIDQTTDLVSADLIGGDSLVIASDLAAVSRVGAHTVASVQDANTVLISGGFASADVANVQYYTVRGTPTQIAALPSGTQLSAVAATITVTDADFVASPYLDDVPANMVGALIVLSGVAAANNNLSAAGNNTYLILSAAAGGPGETVFTVGMADGTTAFGAAETVGAVLSSARLSAVTAVSAATRRPFRQLLDPNATFLTDSVNVGDLVVSAGFTAAVESVLSEERLLLAQGTNLPASNLILGDTDVAYSVERALDKAGQVEVLSSIVGGTGGLNSQRVLMVWPDKVRVAGVVNAKTQTQNWLPAYYMACAVGGMSAGFPPHQGFTYISVAGIDRIRNSTDHFRLAQIDALSAAGWYVFLQDTPQSAPYCAHQLTTDTSTTEFGEYSLVRNFDYISLYYRNILRRFLGRYNITPETLDILGAAIGAGTEQLKLQTYPRIGAPIIEATVQEIKPLAGQKDRVEIFMTVDRPYPLNRIGLHIKA